MSARYPSTPPSTNLRYSTPMMHATPSRPLYTSEPHATHIREYYSSKEALLGAIKGRLQTLYDAHRLTRPEFVAIAKNTFRILSHSESVGEGDVPPNAFMASWNDQFLDTALKLQLELLGIMWPPVSSGPTHLIVNTPIQRSRAPSIVSERPLSRLAIQRTRPPSPTDQTLVERMPIKPFKLNLHPLHVDEIDSLVSKEAYFRQRVAEVEESGRSELKGLYCSRSLALSSSRSASVNVDYNQSEVLAEPQAPTSSPPQGNVLVADAGGGIASPPPLYANLVFAATPKRGPGSAITPEGLRSLYHTVRMGTPSRGAGGRSLPGRGRGATPTPRGSASAARQHADPYGVLSPRQHSAPLPALPKTHHPSRAEVVEHIRSLLQPAYNTGLMTPQSFAAVVKYVSQALDEHGFPRGFAWQDVVALHVKAGCSAIGLL